jgi:hypothetical protein
VKRWGIVAVAAPAAGYGLLAAGGRLVAIGAITVARSYYMLLDSKYELVAAGRQLEDRPLLDGRADGWAAFRRSALRTAGARAVTLAGARPV